MIASNLLAPCQQLTNTLASGELAKLDRIHIPDQSESTLSAGNGGIHICDGDK